MKKELSFIVSMIILGAASGLLIARIMFAASVPESAYYLLTVAEKADYELMEKSSEWYKQGYMAAVIGIVMFILGRLAFGFLVFLLNPNLKRYLDQSKWHVGERAIPMLINVLVNFGKLEEARKWEKTLKTKYGMENPILIPDRELMTTGRITGSLTINSAAPINAKVALIWNAAEKDNINVYSLRYLLTDVRLLKGESRFEFNNIREGDYFLSLMTDAKTIDFSAPPETITIENLPGVLRVEPNRPELNLGEINIVTVR